MMDIVSTITTVFKHVSTEKDGETYCPARILWTLGTLVYLVFAGYMVYTTHSFNCMEFAGGFAAIQAAGSAAVKIKETTEQTTS